MNKNTTLPALLLSLSCLLSAPSFAQQPQGEEGPFAMVWGRMVPVNQYIHRLHTETDSTFTPRAWGDQGNGTYVNPVLNADFSDPDVIRVGETYYMVASDFHFLGMQLLSSRDLVNWDYVTQIYSRFETPGWDGMPMNYANGSWAPSIRYHDGRFYVFFCSPVDGLYMTSAESPEGPWSELHLLWQGAGWEDPCPFWDEDGQAYLGHSRTGAGPIIIHRMTPDGKTLLDDGVEVYRGPVAEGTKFHKINGYYYLSIPEGGVSRGNQVVLRSASIYGPYDKKVVLEKGSTKINGPHQGALVDTPDGRWYFMHFQQTPVLGRVVHLQPVTWQEGWPVIGVDIDRNGIGEPVFCWEKPFPDTTPGKPFSSDDFSSPVLSPAWQFNHNPVPEAWSLTEKKGMLSIHALQAPNFILAHNTLTQKLFGYRGSVTVTLDTKGMAEGQRCGLGVMGTLQWCLGAVMEGGRKYLVVDELINGEQERIPLKASRVWLRFTYDAQEISFQYYYSLDGKNFTKAGGEFRNFYGNWKGVRPALYSFNTKQDGGTACFDDFTVDYDEKH